MKTRPETLDPKPYLDSEIEIVDRRIRVTCHPLQEWFVFDPATYLSLLTCRGAGKTTAALMRLLRRAVRTVNGNCLFIAGTRISAERLVWLDLKRLLTKLKISATWSEATLTATLRNGARIMLFGADDRKDINNLRGITYHEVVVDECATIKQDLLTELLDEVIGPRMIGALTLMGTPGDHLAGLFYDVTRPAGTQHRPYKLRDLPEYAGWLGFSSHGWNLQDGIEHGIAVMAVFWAKALEKKAGKGWSDTNPVWLREYIGVWVADESTLVYAYKPHDKHGKEWNVWDPERTTLGFALRPDHAKDWGWGIGMDIGFSDALAIEVFVWSYTHPSRTIWHVYEVYRTKLGAKAVAELLIGEALDHAAYAGIVGAMGSWPDVLVGDFASSGGALLSDLSTVYGISVVAADKPYKYKANSIAEANSMLHEGQIKVLKGSALEAEMTSLQWVVDEYGKRTENKGHANHATDSLIYFRDAVSSMLPSAVAEPKPGTTPPNDTTVDLPARKREPEYGDADSMYDVTALAI